MRVVIVRKRCIRESGFRPAGTILDVESIFKDACYTSYAYHKSSCPRTRNICFT